MRPQTSVILGMLVYACGGGASSDASSGAATEPTATGWPGVTESTATGTPTGGDATVGDATTLDPAFTDSSQLTGGPVGTGSTGEPPPPNMCEASGLCFDPGGCVECSIASDCADEFAACLAVPGGECMAYSDCVTACAGDGACTQNCYLAHPGGYDPAWALSDCSLCDVCPNSCAALGAYCVNGGGGPGKTETCDQLGDCGQCSACSAFKGCAGAVQACMDDPQCQPYQSCVNGCAADDAPCVDTCQDLYPGGYLTAWAQFDCAVCSECPASCATDQPYCQSGGGGPSNECASNEDCVEISDSLPYCVSHQCVECLGDVDCFELDAPNCSGNFCA